jgi:hypothetical protein
MEPLSFLLVTVSAVVAYFTKSFINQVTTAYHAKSENSPRSDTLEIRTADGGKFTIDAEKLTREKAAEIVESRSSAAHAAL